MTKPELLAPAGSWEAMTAAVQNGADAVYMGGSRFSARANAENFDDIQMEQAIDYCHLRGVKAFVALNTLLKPGELEQAAQYAALLRRMGADALIVQDLGLAAMLRSSMPDLPLHASTQMTIHSAAGAAAVEKMGFKRAVLARELTREQIVHMRHETKLELEIFVHGALCYCYSGQCLFSSMLGGRSGNRGRCAQPCRLPYELFHGEGKQIASGHLLSPKDLCLLDSVEEMARMGVDSLKIEGRLKRPEYVAAVTQVYRKYIDHPTKPSREDVQTLLNAFNRSGFTKGYYAGETGGQMMSYKTPSNIAPETFPEGIERTFHPDANLRKVPVTAQCKISIGEPMAFRMQDADGNTATVLGASPEPALSQPLDRERATRQLSKFGATPFELTKFSLELEGEVSVPIRALNAIRRDAAVKLSDRRIMNAKREEYAAAVARIGGSHTGWKPGNNKPAYSVQVQTLEQAHAILPFAPQRIYAPLEIAAQLQREAGGCEIVSVLPDFLADKKLQTVHSIETDGVMTGVLGLGEDMGARHKVYGGFRLNLYNPWAVQACLEKGFCTVTLSPELTMGEAAQVQRETGGAAEVLVYGHLPLMVMKNCVMKACSGRCGKQDENFYLRDRKGETLPLICEPDACVNLLLNAKPLYMADKLAELSKSGLLQLQLSFTIEPPERCAEVMQAYADGANGIRPARLFSENEFTRGHFYRGVF